jgi:hypothetical protein
MHARLAIREYKFRIQLSNLTFVFLDVYLYVSLQFTNVEAIA